MPVKEIAAPYQDRELTWLDFDTRVLELTEDPTIPLFGTNPLPLNLLF
jgi:polyphosphate kinase